MLQVINYIKNNLTYRDVPWLMLFFVLPVFPSLISSAIVLIILATAVYYKSCKFNLLENKMLILPFLLYLVYMLGLIFTDTPGMKSVVAERKLSFLIFPLLFVFQPGFKRGAYQAMWFAFFSGLLLYISLSVVNAVVNYRLTGNPDAFFSSAFSYDLHPSYSAFYLCTSAGYILFHLIAFPGKFSNVQKILLVALLSVFSFTVFLLASKAGIIGLVLVMLMAVIYFAVSRKKIKQVLIISGIMLAFFSVLLTFNSVPLQRFKNAFSVNSMSREELFKNNHNSIESNVVRRMIWIVSGEIISEYPWGVGSGDANVKLMEKYREKQMEGALQKEFNAHNQYLQIALATGYTGLLILLLFILVPFVTAFRTSNFLMIIFLLLLAVNLSVESMFETESGIVFICLFYCFLYCQKEKISKFI